MCRIPTCTFIGGFLCKARQAFLLVRLFVQSADFLCRRDYLCKARCERKNSSCTKIPFVLTTFAA
jgi:hypothetical protein